MSRQKTEGMTSMDMFKIVINLVIIYAVGGLILATVYAKTSPIIFQKAKQEKEDALKDMIEAESIKPIGEWYPYKRKHAEYYEAKSGGETVGYIIETFGKGYSSYINILVSVNTDLVVQKINVLHHGETPGLGDEIELDYFKDQFKGKTIETLKVVKDGDPTYVQAISGATISSQAVTEAGVKPGVQMMSDLLSGKTQAETGEHGEGGH